jgi:hypothetical protein
VLNISLIKFSDVAVIDETERVIDAEYCSNILDANYRREISVFATG